MDKVEKIFVIRADCTIKTASFERSQYFFSTLRKYVNAEFINVSYFKLQEIRNISNNNFLIFFEDSIDFRFLKCLLKNKLCHKKVIVVSTLDQSWCSINKYFEDLIACNIFLNCGIYENSNHWLINYSVPGFGFISPYFTNGIPLFNKNFKSRKNIFYFRGTLCTFTNKKPILDLIRSTFLGGFKEVTRTNIIMSYNYAFEHTSCKDAIKIADTLCTSDLGKREFMEELSQYKFSLAPDGCGHTYRVIESFSQKCCTFCHDLSTRKFCVDFFKDGYNYIAIKDDKDIKDKVDFILENPAKAEEIANNARLTYNKYFDVKKEILPDITFRPLLDSIIKKVKENSILDITPI